MKYGIPENELEKVVGIISRESRVEGIVLYGSRAKKIFRLGSDIDLCLEAPGLDSPALLRIENELDDLLHGRSTSRSGIESAIPTSSIISRA